MVAMEWTDQLSVGIPSIDKQHQKLIKLFNDFYDSIQKKDSKERIAFVIKGLKDYTVEHFNSEEANMRMYHFPGYIAHKKDHDDFVQAVHDFEDRFHQGKLILTVEITTFIREWITKHIMDIDKQYTAFFIQKGLH